MDDIDAARENLARALARLETAAGAVRDRSGAAAAGSSEDAERLQSLQAELSEAYAETARLKAENQKLKAEVKRLDHAVLDARMKAMPPRPDLVEAEEEKRRLIRADIDRAIAAVDRILAEDDRIAATLN